MLAFEKSHSSLGHGSLLTWENQGEGPATKRPDFRNDGHFGELSSRSYPLLFGGGQFGGLTCIFIFSLSNYPNTLGFQ